MPLGVSLGVPNTWMVVVASIGFGEFLGHFRYGLAAEPEARVGWPALAATEDD